MLDNFNARLYCRNTGEHFPLDASLWQSPEGHLLDLAFTPAPLNLAGLAARPYNLWRYAEVLPLPENSERVSLGEQITPLVAIELQGKSCQIKVDYQFASGSYKDRGAALLMSFVKHLGIKKVVQDSSGNAGAAIAAYAAAAQIACDIFVPASTSKAKLAQIQMYGANLKLIEGAREASAQAAQIAAQATFYASHVWQPLFLHGTKTFAYELCEQLGWQAPDVIVLPAGNGTLLLGAFIGFQELYTMGITRHLPKIIGVQAANCAPLWAAFHQKDTPDFTPTLAEGIAIAQPARAEQMLEAIAQTGGSLLKVSEDDILATWQMLGKKGWFVEPTSAAVIAGLRQYLAQNGTEEKLICSVLSGQGLKASQTAAKLF